MKKRLVPVYSVLVVAIVLLAVLVPSCGGDGRTFDLTMAVSPLGTGTATDVTGGSPYASGAIVNIQASPAVGYTFVQWTALAGTFANPNAAITTFTMPAQNVTVTAHFVGPLDHLKCYPVADAPPIDKLVHLKDQFIELDATVNNTTFFCNPTDKVYYGNVTNTSNPDHHWTIYAINHTEYGRFWNVNITNQFGTWVLTVGGPVALAVPTQKVEPGGHEKPFGADHYLLYQVVSEGCAEAMVDLKDEFGIDTAAGVCEPMFFANPVQKTAGTDVPTPIFDPDQHLLFYKLWFTNTTYTGQVQVVNQFSTGTAPQNLYLGGPATLLGVPSEKIAFAEQFDHFLAYSIDWEAPSLWEEVSLKDQFVDITVNVTDPHYFCNPAAKTFTESWPPIVFPNYHLTTYTIYPEGSQSWLVYVENQFGKQMLTVWGPVGLAVPTQKLVPGDHQPSVGLDHFTLYAVMPGPYDEHGVWVRDEFSYPDGESTGVYAPYLFAVPASKTHGTAPPINIINPLTHIMFYAIQGNQVTYPEVRVVDQFITSAHNLTLGYPAYMLGVPTLKLWAEEQPQ